MGDKMVSEKSSVTYLQLASITPSKTNPRTTIAGPHFDELVESVREHGVLQPVLVRPRDPGGLYGYEIVAGHRRFAAAQKAGRDEIPALVSHLSDLEVLEIQLIENLHRADIHPLEEAAGYQRLIATAKYDAARIGERIGRSAKYVYDRVKLLQLVPEAQSLFRADRITAGHAILLARLKAADQERAITTDIHSMRNNQALFVEEYSLWDPDDRADEDGEPSEQERAEDPYAGLKVRTVRELSAWIDEHVRFDIEHDPDPMLFPETAATLETAENEELKIIPITHAHHIPPEARTEKRTYGPRSWRRADGTKGSKTCELSITGFVAVGPGRGEAFPVCIAKEKCEVHWGTEIRAKRKRAKATSGDGKTGGAKKSAANEKHELQRQAEAERLKKQEEERARWEKAKGPILAAMAEAVLKAPAGGDGALAKLLIGSARGYGEKTAGTLVQTGPKAEDVVRHAGFLLIRRELGSWTSYREFPKLAKAFGVDVQKIMKASAPAPAQTSAVGAAKPRKRGTKKK